VGDDSNRHGLAIAARPWTTEALEAAQHTIDLEDSGTMWLNIDTAVHGIGTASCGPGVQPQYQLEAKEMAFEIAFRDLSGIRTKL
jgi:beta-galactosidase